MELLSTTTELSQIITNEKAISPVQTPIHKSHPPAPLQRPKANKKRRTHDDEDRDSHSSEDEGKKGKGRVSVFLFVFLRFFKN